MVKTFKQKVLDNPRLLTPKEDIYVNKKVYDWGELNFRDIDLTNTHEIYDLVDNKYFYKLATPFEHGSPQPTFFKKIENDKDYDLEQYFEELKGRTDITFFKVSFPNKYFIKNSILLIINKDEYESLTDIQKEHYITINAYTNLVLRKCEVRTWKSISNAAPLDNSALNWVWFRKPGYKLSQAIADKAQSWIDLNPELKFVLWTDLENEDELKEFLSDIKSDTQREQYINGTVTVKFLQDTVDFVKTYLVTYKDKDAIKNFKGDKFLELIQSREYNKTLIAKTDFLRAMILHDQGGFYADFNDCQCMIPIRYWFQELYRKQQFILPCDTFNEGHISNFFIYVPKGSKGFRNLHFETLKGFDGILKCFKDETTPKQIASLYLPFVKKYLKKLKLTQTCEPTQLLVDTIFPAYDNSKFVKGIRETLGESGIKGLERSDIRAKIFFPLFVLKYIAQKHNDDDLMEFFEYMVEEFKQIGNIQLYREPPQFSGNGQIKPRSQPNPASRKFEIKYFSQHHVEDYDDIDDVLKSYDDILTKIDELENDPEFDKFIFDLFTKNMAAIPMHMTNIILHLPKELSFHELVPFCFVFINMTYLTMVGHFGDGGSTGLVDDEEKP